jgi:hypothetical protein
MGTITQSIANNLTTGLGGASGVNFRNIIINGDMSIAQRGTSESGITGSGYNTVDRFSTNILNMGTFTESQSTDVPTGQGFATSLKLDCTTADASPAAGDNIQLRQKVEGQNLQYLKYGTSSAESTTLSFWVKSSKTGTYIVELRHHDDTKFISQSYTISSASTWEKKTLTFPGYTTTAFDNDNNASLFINWWLGAGTNFTSGTLNTSWNSLVDANSAVGQVNLADDTANEWYITGVQLEAGTTASDFEFLPVDVNLARCQRYYYALLNTGEDNNYFISGYYYTGSYIYCHTEFPTTMRASPSLVQSSGTDYYTFYSNSVGDGFDSFNQNITFLTRNATFGNNSQVSGTAGHAGRVYSTNTNSYVHFNAEL